VNYNLTTTTCNVTIETSLNGTVKSMGSLPELTFTGPLNSYSYRSTPQTPYSIADASGSTFTLTVPSLIDWTDPDSGRTFSSGYSGADVTEADGTVISYPPSTLSPNPSCSAGGSLTYKLNYTTAPILEIK